MVELFGSNILKITLFIFILVYVKRFFTFKYFSKLNLPVVLFVLASIISLIVNFSDLNDPINSMASIVAVFSYFVIFSQEEGLKNILYVVVISLLVSSIYCIFRPETISEWTFRKTGGTGDPNEFSTMVLLGISLMWGYFIIYRKNLLLIITISFIFLSSLLLAGSKSAFLTLFLITFFICLFFLSNSSGIQKLKVLSIFVIGMFLLGYLLQNFYGDTLELFLARFENNKTGNERFKSWNAGLDLFTNNIFFGVGPLNYSVAVGERYLASIAEASREAHNLFLKALIETGIFGIVPFLFIIYIAFRVAINSLSKEITFLVLTGLFLMGLTLSLTFEKYTWLTLALILNTFLFNKLSFEPSKDR